MPERRSIDSRHIDWPLELPAARCLKATLIGLCKQLAVGRWSSAIAPGGAKNESGEPLDLVCSDVQTIPA